MSTAAPDARAPSLALRRVHKRFGEVVALDDAGLEVAPGTVHALLGENGAGKTTLVRIAFGLVRADAGEVLVDGVVRRFRSSADAIAAGIGMVHQHFSLVPAMTAAENAALGGHGLFHPREAAARLAHVAAEAGLRVDPNARVDELGVAAQQRLEIVKALARGARVLILDEPTAVLAPSETDELLAWLRRFASGGGAAVLITHKLREAIAVADDVTVLRRGRTVLSRAAGGIGASELAAAMVGPAAGDDVAVVLEAERSDAATTIGGPPPTAKVAPTAHSTITDPALVGSDGLAPATVRAHHVTLSDARGVTIVRDATFTVDAGEIVGVAAVEGAGQHELLRALAGRQHPTAGVLMLPAADGTAFIPEDRHRDGVALELSLVENVALRGAGARRGLVRWRELARRATGLIAHHDVRAAGAHAPMSTLSGGNQQKLVLARELSDGPALVVAENPTRGLDVHATAQVHARLREARDRGAAVVVYSTDLDEVLALATRVLVVHAGTVRELPLDRERVGRAMLGAE